MSSSLSNWFITNYGMMAHEYAKAFPDITEAMRRLYRERLVKFPGLPPDWLAMVNHQHGKDGVFLFPVSSRATGENGQPAKFLTTPQARQAWDKVVEELNAIRMAMLEKNREKALKLVQAAERNAAFWDTTYQWARVLAAPVTAAGAVVRNPWLSGTALWAGLAVVAFLVFRSRFQK